LPSAWQAAALLFHLIGFRAERRFGFTAFGFSTCGVTRLILNKWYQDQKRRSEIIAFGLASRGVAQV
jgi:hypothetical protein